MVFFMFAWYFENMKKTQKIIIATSLVLVILSGIFYLYQVQKKDPSSQKDSDVHDTSSNFYGWESDPSYVFEPKDLGDDPWFCDDRSDNGFYGCDLTEEGVHPIDLIWSNNFETHTNLIDLEVTLLENEYSGSALNYENILPVKIFDYALAGLVDRKEVISDYINFNASFSITQTPFSEINFSQSFMDSKDEIILGKHNGIYGWTGTEGSDSYVYYFDFGEYTVRINTYYQRLHGMTDKNILQEEIDKRNELDQEIQSLPGYITPEYRVEIMKDLLDNLEIFLLEEYQQQQQAERSFQELLIKLKGEEVFIEYEYENGLGENLLQEIDFSNAPEFGTVTSPYLTYDGDCVEVSRDIKNLSNQIYTYPNICDPYTDIKRDKKLVFIRNIGEEWRTSHVLNENKEILVELGDAYYYFADNYIISSGSDNPDPLQDYLYLSSLDNSTQNQEIYIEIYRAIGLYGYNNTYILQLVNELEEGLRQGVVSLRYIQFNLDNLFSE